MESTTRAVAGLLSAVLISGCSLLQKKERPLDINENMPAVTNVIRAVQAAIDETAENSGWNESNALQSAKRQCAEERKKAAEEYKQTCDPAVSAAREACRKESGETAQVVCADHLREALAACGAEPDTPAVCSDVAALRPPKIKIARLELTAATASNVGGGASLKLISAGASAKSGLSSTYVLELVPAPKIKPFLDDARQNVVSNKTNFDPITQSLKDALLVALNAAVVEECKPVDSRVKCTWSTAPQMTLKKASYQFEINYEKVSSAEFTWTISSLKILDGKFGAGNERKTSNVLTVEIER